jgi:hypothetical protein
MELGVFLAQTANNTIVFRKEVSFEVGSGYKVSFLSPTYISLLKGQYMSVNDVGIRRVVRAN